MSSTRPELVFSGLIASQGLASGVIELHRSRRRTVAGKGSPSQERDRLEQAIAEAATQLRSLSSAAGEAGSEILELQIALLEDPELLAPIRQAILGGEAAATAWAAALDQQAADYRSAEDRYFRARAADLEDLRDRVLALLEGVAPDTRSASEAPIYVGEDLAPSRFLEIDWRRYRGAAIANGSTNSHLAILARARGVPLLVGMDIAQDAIRDGAPAILDVAEGRLIQDPAAATATRFRNRLAAQESAAEALAIHLPRPAVTQRGARILVHVNVDDPRILEGVDPAHCDGIGLTRTEFLFHGAAALPDEAAQLAAYGRLVDWASGRPVTIRTLDAGGDKPIAGLTPVGETNPFLGLRGVRLSLAHADVFRVQLRALARAAVEGTLKVMLPMVTAPREVEEVRRMFEDAIAELSREGVAARMPILGMMVEVPAAAINIAAFDVEFYSIGSNDLVQYVTATSRDCASVAGLHDPLDPAVLELIGRVVRFGAESGREVGLCGDMAAEPRCLHALLDLGLRSVSVAPARLALAKSEIARHG